MTENTGGSPGGLLAGGTGGRPPGGLLPTTVVGSYSVPEWLERLKTEYYQRRISAAHLAEIHEVAIKAAVKDQERAGIDIVSDGELRRDNDIDYFLARIPGVHIAQRAKADYYDYCDASVTAPLPEGDGSVLGLAGDFEFTRALTDRPVKFSFTGPFSLARRLVSAAYNDPADLVRALARRLNTEARALSDAGARFLQIDEPFLAGYPEQAALAVEAVNIVTDGVPATWALHVCYATATRALPGRGTTTSSSPPCLRRGSTSSCSNSRARVWTTCGSSGSMPGRRRSASA